ncbi:PAS domain-containing protein [Fulvivirga sedimenti]|jgi:PAS domain S-box-containing protein|uniref:histidine kinase n=1 Tax=Fulvivirga sedimenti TaxID=2879465 RepID=A0A9X1KW79_9BACT|nr:PAS domain-containing protein [Fulvivirga sedimenti]MCA6073699.1 PAS domain-containing protein [Fulvivirga sedimenti]
MPRNFIQSVIAVSHIEFASYDLKNHALLYSSGLAGKILGYSEAEMKSFAHDFNRMIIHPDDIEVADAKMEEIMASRPGQIIEMIIRYKRKDGRYIWGYTRKLVSEWDENGKPAKITSVAQDVTEMVSIQEELARRVAQLDEISYRNAHDLRGPVASILGLTNLMKDKGMIEDYYQDLLQHLCSAVEKLDNVVGELINPDQEEKEWD